MSYIGVPPFGQTVRTVTTATANGTADTFYPTGGYIVGYLDVYYNGVRVVEYTDYTASDGVGITFATAPLTDAVIEMVSYGPISMTNAVLKSGDNMAGTLNVRDVIPLSNSYSLGNTTNRFANLYLTGNTIILGDQIISANSTHITFANTTGGTPNSSLSGSSVTVVDSVSNSSATAAASANSVKTAYLLAANGVSNTYLANTYATKSNTVFTDNITFANNTPNITVGNSAGIYVQGTYPNTQMVIYAGGFNNEGILSIGDGMVSASQFQLSNYSYPLDTFWDVAIQDINYSSNHTTYIFNTTGAVRLNFSNMPTFTEYKAYFFRVFMGQGATPRVPTAQINGANTTIKWNGGTTPTPTANSTSMFEFNIIRAGGLWWEILGNHTTFK